MDNNGVGGHLELAAVGGSAHFIYQGVVIRQTGGKGSQDAVGGCQFAVDIPLVALLAGNVARLVVHLYLRQGNIVDRVNRRTDIMERNFGIESTVGFAFLNTAYQHFVLVEVDIAVLTDNVQYISFVPQTTAPHATAAFVNHQLRLASFLADIEAVIGIVTAPVPPPVRAVGMGATLVVDTHHGGSFLATDYVAVDKVAFHIGSRSQIVPIIACIVDNLSSVDVNHLARTPPLGRLRRRTVAGVDNLFGRYPQAVRTHKLHVNRVAARATVAGGFHFEIGGGIGHGQNHNARVFTYGLVVNINGGTVVERGPLVVDARILLGHGVQGQVVVNTKRIGNSIYLGGINHRNVFVVGSDGLCGETFVIAVDNHKEDVSMLDFSTVNQRIGLFPAGTAYGVGLNKYVIAIQLGGSVFKPPIAADRHTEGIAFTNPPVKQGELGGEFMFNIINVNRIVAMATGGRSRIHHIGEPTRINGVELHIRKVCRLAGQIGGRIPSVAVIGFGGTIVCRILNIERMVGASMQRVGEVDYRHGVESHTHGIDIAAIEVVYGSVENIGARGVEQTAPGKREVFGNRQGVDNRIGDHREPIACAIYRREGARFGNHTVFEAYGFRTADNPVCPIFFKLVIFAMRDKEEHAVCRVATELVGYFLYQPDAFRLLVGHTQYIGGMRGIGIYEVAVATGNPMRCTTYSRIGGEYKVGIIANRVVHTGFRTYRPQEDARLFTYQRTVPGAEILAERPNTEHFVSGKVLGRVVQIFVCRTGDRRRCIVFGSRHIPLQVGFFDIVTFGHTDHIGMHGNHHIAVIVGTSRIYLRRDNHIQRIGREYHQGGDTLVADTVGGARQAGFNPAYDIVVGAVLGGLLLDVDDVENRRVDGNGIAPFVAHGGQEAVHIPTVLRIGSAIGNVSLNLIFAVGANRIQFKAQLNLYIRLRNRNHGKHTRLDRTVDRVVAFGGIHVQDSINLTADRQVGKGYRIASLNERTVSIPFDIPVVAAVFEYRTGIGNGGEQTGGFTHADTQGIVVDMAVRLDVDTGLFGLFHHNRIHNRILTHPQADTVILNDYRNFIGGCRGEVGTLQGQTVEVVARFPISAAPVPGKVHIGLVVGFNPGNRRELTSPASRIGQAEVVFHKVYGTAVSYLNRNAVRTELTTVNIGKHHLDSRVFTVGNHHTDGIGGMTRIPKHTRTRSLGYPKGGRIITANRQ